MLPVAVRDLFETIMCKEAIQEVLEDSRYQLRERKKNAALMLFSMIAASAGGRGGKQAAVLRLYTSAATVSANEAGIDPQTAKPGKSGMYRWFDKRLSKCLEMLASKAMAYAAAQKKDLPGWLGEDVRDWLIIDSTTCKLDYELKEEYPGTGDYAAIKVHKTMSVGTGCVVDYHFSPAREHDSRHLDITEKHRGFGIRADLGYASFDRLTCCDTHGVFYAIRLKDSWKPKVTEITRGGIKKALNASADFDMVLAKNLALDGKCVDMVVVLTKGKKKLQSRVVGVCGPNSTYRWYLTNLPPKRGPQQVSDLYRVRWEIESENKLSKSSFALDEMSSRTAGALHAMLHAAMIGTMLSCLITHVHRLETKPDCAKNEVPERDVPPLHPRLVAAVMQTNSAQISIAMTTEDEKTKKLMWEVVTGEILRWGVDTNWRTKPSILDQLRGWKVKPHKRRVARLSSKKKH